MTSGATLFTIVQALGHFFISLFTLLPTHHCVFLCLFRKREKRSSDWLGQLPPEQIYKLVSLYLRASRQDSCFELFPMSIPISRSPGRPHMVNYKKKKKKRKKKRQLRHSKNIRQVVSVAASLRFLTRLLHNQQVTCVA